MKYTLATVSLALMVAGWGGEGEPAASPTVVVTETVTEAPVAPEPVPKPEPEGPAFSVTSSCEADYPLVLDRPRCQSWQRRR